MEKFSELKAAAEKYSLTLNAHKENPKDADAVVAWDEATWEMSRLINNDEVNIIVALLAELEATESRLHEVATACATAEQRIAELEFIRSSCGQVLNEIGGELGCNPDNESIMVAIDDLKATQMTGPLKDVLKRNIELEAKLATPVRLSASTVMSRRYVVEAIRAAGFTVEGDE